MFAVVEHQNLRTMTTTFKIHKYISPMCDFGFKKIFKESGKKQLLIRPLNAIFGLDIADLEIGESERLGQTPEDRKASFDLFCTSADGRRFIVEVQLMRQEHFLERALYYATFPISESARKDGAEAWDFDFPPVFVLGLLNFDFRGLSGHEDGTCADQFIHRFSLRDDDTGERMTDRLRFAFLEVQRFDKGLEECESFEEKFLYMMKNLPIFVGTPAPWEADPYFVEMLREAEYARMSREEKAQYRESMRQSWDYQNTIDYARKEGRQQGHAQGLAQGLEEGRTEGQAEKARAIARRMLADGLSAEVVAKYTDLAEEQVLALAEEPVKK